MVLGALRVVALRLKQHRKPGKSFPDPPGGSEKVDPLIGTLTTKGYFMGTPLRDLLFGFSRGSALQSRFQMVLGALRVIALRLKQHKNPQGV